MSCPTPTFEIRVCVASEHNRRTGRHGCRAGIAFLRDRILWTYVPLLSVSWDVVNGWKRRYMPSQTLSNDHLSLASTALSFSLLLAAAAAVVASAGVSSWQILCIIPHHLTFQVIWCCRYGTDRQQGRSWSERSGGPDLRSSHHKSNLWELHKSDEKFLTYVVPPLPSDVVSCRNIIKRHFSPIFPAKMEYIFQLLETSVPQTPYTGPLKLAKPAYGTDR